MGEGGRREYGVLEGWGVSRVWAKFRIRQHTDVHTRAHGPVLRPFRGEEEQEEMGEGVWCAVEVVVNAKRRMWTEMRGVQWL